MTWHEWILSIVAGVLVTAIGWVAGQAWNGRHIPEMLGRSMRRDAYLQEVLQESQRADLSTLDVIAPRLHPAAGMEVMTKIQAAWEAINGRGRVQVITLDTDECLQGSAELLKDGIEVRVAGRQLGADSMSYHVFGSVDISQTVILNHRSGNRDQPVRIVGAPPAQLFRDHFDAAWHSAVPLESVIAEKTLALVGRRASKREVLDAFRDVRSLLKLDARCVDRVLPHLAFRHSCPVILLVGLPGAGKSFVRRRLAAILREKRIESRSLSDYPFAYRDFLSSQILLDRQNEGFEPYLGGAFTAANETTLEAALLAMFQIVNANIGSTVNLVEFARMDNVAALQSMLEIRDRCWIIYVDAPAKLRVARLSRRAQPPILSIDGNHLKLALSDDHLLPSGAERTLYHSGSVDPLLNSRIWRERVFQIANDVDDRGRRVDSVLRDFVDGVTADYQLAKADLLLTR